MAEVFGVVEPTPEIVVELMGGSGGGTNDHTQLINRDAEDSHPIDAITGLSSQLDSKISKNFLTNLEIQEILNK